MDDQRIVAGPPLDRKNAGHGLRVQGIGTQSVDRLGRKSDQLAPPQRYGCRQQQVVIRLIRGSTRMIAGRHDLVNL